MNNGHAFGEAFMLMRYEDDLGNVEVIWNSRDGVTPFIELSRLGRQMTHKHWNVDVYAPDHKPNPGDRIFTDLTFDELVEIETKKVEMYWEGQGNLSMKYHPTLGPMGKQGAAQNLAEEGWSEGMPTIIEVK